MKKASVLLVAATALVGAALYGTSGHVKDFLAAKEKYDELRVSYDGLRKQYDSLQNSITQIRERHKKKLETAKKAYDDLSGQVKQIQETHKDEIEQARKTIGSLEVDLNAAQERMTQLKSEADKYKEAFQRILTESRRAR